MSCPSKFRAGGLEADCEAFSDPLGMKPVKVIGPLLAIARTSEDHRVNDAEKPVRHGDGRFLRSGAAADPIKQRSEKRPLPVDASRRPGCLHQRPPHIAFAFAGAECRLPALSALPGHSPQQLARCPAVGNRLISTPISEMTIQAASRSIAGISHSRSTSSWCGSMRS